MTSTLGGLKWRLVGSALAALVVLGVGSFMPEFAILQATNWALYGLLALSLTFVWGHAGIFSFGQGAFFGAGAYAYGVAAINWLPYTNETFSAVLAGALAGALLAGAVGYFMFYGKVGDVYVGIITLAMTLVLFTLMSSTADPKYHLGDAQLGGYNGMSGVPPLSWPGTDGPQALSSLQMFVFVVLVCATLLALLYVILERPFGRVLAALRENELRTQLLGFDIRLRKLFVFSIGGSIAGTAGALYAAWAMFVSPIVFGLQLAALGVIWVLVGGRMSLAGAFIGALLVEALASSLGGSGGDATPILLGSVLILVVLFLPQGIVPTLLRLLRRRWVPITTPVVSADAATEAGAFEQLPLKWALGGAALRAENLGKNFGGVKAVQQANVSFANRGVHCLIGPNGAGKSTFFNLLAGRFPASAGRIMLGEREITRLECHARVRLGLGIKLQVASIFTALTVQENLWLASFGRHRDGRTAAQSSAQLLRWLGLSDRGDALAGTLAHGQKQWLEIAMVMASEPSVILLDEPAAGMSNEETSRLADLLRRLGEGTTVIVVEHDMEFVRSLDAPVTVFHQGSVFASGSMDELRRDDRILDIYLGRHEPKPA